VPSTNAAGFKGVVQNGGNYSAKANENGEPRYLGTFDTPEEAALQYARHCGKCAAKVSQRGKKRQREQHEQHDRQPASSSQGPEHSPPQLTGDIETVVIGGYTFRCCASSRASIIRPAVEGQPEVDRAGDH